MAKTHKLFPLLIILQLPLPTFIKPVNTSYFQHQTLAKKRYNQSEDSSYESNSKSRYPEHPLSRPHLSYIYNIHPKQITHKYKRQENCRSDSEHEYYFAYIFHPCVALFLGSLYWICQYYQGPCIKYKDVLLE